MKIKFNFICVLIIFNLNGMARNPLLSEARKGIFFRVKRLSSGPGSGEVDRETGAQLEKDRRMNTYKIVAARTGFLGSCVLMPFSFYLLTRGDPSLFQWALATGNVLFAGIPGAIKWWEILDKSTERGLDYSRKMLNLKMKAERYPASAEALTNRSFTMPENKITDVAETPEK